MLETIITAAVVAGITGLATFAIQERRLRADLRTEFMAEQVAKDLLESPDWRKRKFKEIQKRLGGFEDDELRKILVRAGAARFEKSDGTELWGLIQRNKDDV
jgi:hypothetical protein